MGQETLRGLAAWEAGMVGFFAAFPDATYTLEDLFVAGDQGVWRGTWHATQRGAWGGIAASGRAVTWTVIIIARFAEGQTWGRLGRVRPVGLVPTARRDPRDGVGAAVAQAGKKGKPTNEGLVTV